MLIRLAAQSRTGLLRTENQDCVLVDGWLSATDGLVSIERQLGAGDRLLLGVFDGLGGHAGGAVASRVAAGIFGHAHLTDADSLRQSFAVAHRALETVSSAEPGLTGMGTTAVVALIEPGQPGEGAVLIAHAGDSLAYRSVNGALGLLTEPDRRPDPFRPNATVLTCCLGAGSDPLPTVEGFRVTRPLRLLLCSDGLTDEVPAATIRDLLAQGDPPGVAKSLVEAAYAGGASDNVSVIVADLIPEPAEPAPAAE